ncbi:MAG: hypothetical protein M3O50_09450, partial [Myxococcota bacterium]|nr:hypothetical protein [Myxococcota bacterium]
MLTDGELHRVRRGGARRQPVMTGVTAIAAALGLVACGPTTTVQRVYDGRLVEGRYVQPEVYAAFLRGALAESAGDVNAALLTYGAAVRDDPTSVELWTRLGDLRCRQSAGDRAADKSFSRAIQLDASYAPAWTAKARCELARGNLAGAETASRRAAELDPAADEANVFLATAAQRARDDVTRVAVVSLSVT